MTPDPLLLREWSRTALSAAEAIALVEDDSIRLLSAGGVLQIVHEAQGSGVRAFGYVGRCLISGRVITIAPRLACDYSPVLAELNESESKVVRDALGLFDDSGDSLAVVEALAAATERYLRIGRVAQYEPLEEESAFPRGRILTAGTRRLWARGKRMRVYVRRRVLRAPSLAESALRRALRLAEDVVGQEDNVRARSLLVRLRAASRLIPPELPIASDILLAAAQDAQRATPPYVRELFSLVCIILNTGGNPMVGLHVIAIPGGIFVDMAEILERAIRRVTRRLLPHLSVLDGNVHKQPFLETPTNTSQPDIVVRSGSRIIALLDVKDKIGTRPARDDIYQLFSHCAGAGADLGVLVFVGEAYQSPRAIGVWNGKITLCSVVLRPNELIPDSQQMLFDLGIAMPWVARSEGE